MGNLLAEKKFLQKEHALMKRLMKQYSVENIITIFFCLFQRHLPPFSHDFMLKESNKNKPPKYPGKSENLQNYYLFIFTITILKKNPVLTVIAMKANSLLDCIIKSIAKGLIYVVIS